jgi:hypothetical protein
MPASESFALLGWHTGESTVHLAGAEWQAEMQRGTV